jgi:hypothetical protein
VPIPWENSWRFEGRSALGNKLLNEKGACVGRLP